MTGSMPIVLHLRLDNLPGFLSVRWSLVRAYIKGLNNIIWKWSFLEILQVALELFNRTTSDNHSISFFVIQLRMMNHPAQSHFDKGKIVLLCNCADDLNCIEIVIFEVASLVH